jgi:uncharacterized LabA/DUF88 family protein
VDQTATFLQIDLQNLFLSSNLKLDFEKIWSHFQNRDAEFLTEAVIYTARSNEFDSSRFETKLKSIGFEVKVKNISKPTRRSKSVPIPSHNILMTVDCLERLDRFNKWIIMTNNGDFSDLCNYVRHQRKKIEIWSVRDCYNPILETYADKMNFFNEDFFLKKPNISVFGINWGLEKIGSDTTRAYL